MYLYLMMYIFSFMFVCLIVFCFVLFKQEQMPKLLLDIALVNV